MLQLNHVSKHYIDGKKVVTALNDVTTSFDVGEFVVVTGSSGSGKSTLLNILSGADYCTGGEYIFNNIDTDSFSENDWDEFRCKNIGLIYQDFKLIDEYTVKENIEAALALVCGSRKEMKTKAKQLMAQTNIGEFANKKVKYLSGGQKQRVAIARALAKDADIILADEPTANLDEENAVEIVQLLKQISANKLIIVVTHNFRQFDDVCTRKITLADGQIAEDVQYRTAKSYGKETKTDKQNTGKRPLFGVLKNKKSLFFVFGLVFIVLFTSLTIYSTSLDMLQNSSEGLINTELYQVLDKDRYIFTKCDKTAFTPSEIENLQNETGADDVVVGDLVLDTLAYVENPFTGNEMELYIRPASRIPQLVRGRLPQTPDEVVLSSENGYPYYMMESEDDYFALRTINTNIHRVKVVGWVRDAQHYRQSVYVNSVLFSELYVENYHRFSNVSIYNDDVRVAITNLIPDAAVPSGKILTDNVTLLNKTVNLSVENNQTALLLSDLIADSLDSNSVLKEKYETALRPVLINYDDYFAIVTKEYYQITVYSTQHTTSTETYNVTYPYAVNIGETDSGSAVRAFVWLGLCLFIAVVLTLVSYFFLRYILKSDVAVNKIRRSIGYSAKDTAMFVAMRMIAAVLFAIILLTAIYVLLTVYYRAIDVENVFIVLSNVPVLQYVLITFLISALYIFLLTRYVVRKSGSLGSVNEGVR